METLRQSMTWMHTWTGLLFGWMLYFMFLTGSSGYYDTEIDRWMKPELAPAVEVTDANQVALFDMALARAEEGLPEADEHRIFLPDDRSFSPYINVFSTKRDEEGKISRNSMFLLADGSTPPETRETAGGQRLYRMHWTYHYIPRFIGEIIAGLVTMFMFAAIISGIITHKKIFKDFFTLRLGKGQRSWLDSHNIVSVMSLPFQIMITFSGLLLVVTTFFIPIFVAQYGWSSDTIKTIESEMFPGRAKIERAGEPAPPIDFAAMKAAFEAELPGEDISYATIHNSGDATSRVFMAARIEDGVLRRSPSVGFEVASGDVIRVTNRNVRDTEDVINVLEGLHEGLFAGPVLRILYFVSGLLGAAMIATGLVLWTKKRRQNLRKGEAAERNLIVIERINVGVIAGLAIGIAAYFYANRLLPVGIAGRANMELNVLFLTWLAMVVHSLARPPQKAWIEQLAIAAAIFMLIPVMNALTSSIHLGNTLPLPGRPGDMALAGVDLWMLVIGAGFAYAARIAARKEANTRKADRKTGKAEKAAPAPQPAE
ncbi:MAG: PepSY-associated TM helix domain-containing protein [Pseudomonadota bacterium]